MAALYGILWQEFVLFKRKFWSTTIGAMVSPTLYLIAFGWGLGSGMQVEGRSYMEFVIPGIIAMSTMLVSFSNAANSINIARMYYKTFEEFMVAPVNMTVFALGKIIAGALYGMYSALLIIILVSVFAGGLPLSPYFILITLLNCFVFSAGGFLAGLMINSHGGMAKFSNFVITPMSFLCGTFFSIEKMPLVLKYFIQVLPLTHTSIGLRSTGEGIAAMALHFGVLAGYFIVLFIVGACYCKKVE
ncbi:MULTISPECIES: ABC transporter permease [Dehalobacter]|jgi:ABC-type multidrug transport system permease subunit|uniref:Transport permease protein n=2 Tax=Dehalobacter restrictus TaxID=55583 RepID=A0A857DG08_9FIRM|nr:MULTISPECIES: ABC transporter permease [Dehalobacter]AHF08957.1 multidrug ABC transporter permease [Dehalobacter restrictus DSM 9455]MCG1025529.1 ABC transporter permease [Dehalobacter sp.]MDJ0306132.1 ABC transporter permease [Dehalobacter sp.]OCZ51909.1 multidrug ABC transporter permease [Dehalobacter sp. TeCB1]QGZ99478.1 ABC transporter permease [Dehalobacter restrictus]